MTCPRLSSTILDLRSTSSGRWMDFPTRSEWSSCSTTSKASRITKSPSSSALPLERRRRRCFARAALCAPRSLEGSRMQHDDEDLDLFAELPREIPVDDGEVEHMVRRLRSDGLLRRKSR